MFTLLEFDNEFLALLVLAVEIKDGLAVDIGVAELLGFQVGEVPDLALFLFEQLVEKVEEEVFIGFFAEDLFETIIGEQIDVAFFGDMMWWA